MADQDCPTPKACREHCCHGACLPAPQQAEPVQQDEPDHETRAELAEQQVVQLAEERDHYRRLWQKAQAEPVQYNNEPSGYESITPAYTRWVSPARYAKFADNVQRWYRPYWLPKAEQQAEPVQEPVQFDPNEALRLADEYADLAADVRAKQGYPDHAVAHDRKLRDEARAALEAYLSRQAEPVQRKPLTEDEIEALFKGVDSKDKGRFAIVRGFARAIEAAHGIKGGGNG